jgi:hypothetical protein
VTDNRMKDRVKVMLSGTSPDSETSEHALITAPNQGQPNQGLQNQGLPQGLPNQALQVLSMAQRTAEEHVATAHHQADKIRTDALAAAEEIARDAQLHAHNVRREADKVLHEARASAELTGREAQARVDDARRNADKVVADAQAQSEAIHADARAKADQLRLQAQQRYEDVVGSLGAKREGLQQQIEALEEFDRDYRARLTAFMQSQMRALWADQPQVNAALEVLEAEPVEDSEPVAEQEKPEIPTQRQGGPVGAHASDDEEE